MLRRALLVLVTGLVALGFGRDTEGSVTNRLVEIRKAVDRMKHHRAHIVKPFLLWCGWLTLGTAKDHGEMSRRISGVKNQLRAEHTATWGDVFVPEGLPGSRADSNRTVFEYNETAVAEADAIAWQWGFWPFTRIETHIA